MNRKPRRIGLAGFATLMLAAVASPVAANAAVVPKLTAQYVASQTSLDGKSLQKTALATATASAAFRIADPLETARQYAPETVPEWEKTLERYDALAKNRTPMATVSVELAAEPVKLEAVGPVEWKTAEAVELKAGQALKVLEAKPIKIANAAAATVSATLSSSGTLPAATETSVVSARELDAVPVTLDSSVVLLNSSAISLNADPVSLSAHTVALAAVEPTDGSIFMGRIELGEAVESKDEKRVKEALVKLLSQYKQQIETMEQAG